MKHKCYQNEQGSQHLVYRPDYFNLVSRSKNWPLSRDYFGSRGGAVVAVAIFKEI